MSIVSWKRVRQIFHEALELPESERQGFVASACGDDERLRDEVEELLAAHDEAGEFLGSPTAGDAEGSASGGPGQAAAAALAEGPGSRIGPYKLLQLIGEGGFGSVYMAEQKEPIRRRVALKIIKVGMDTREVIARFEAERQALAMMDHPNIAKVLDAGSTGTGRPYFVMELVKGVPITEYCDANRLSTRERLELFVLVCNAVQHAHQKGVIHRDLKPSNIMVTLRDSTPVPKVIDFGIAKATAQQLTERTLFTRYGQFIGTPAYMSPEQAEMSDLEVDTRTDIYSLGVLLYELLTGTTPLDSRALRRGAYFEVLRILREEEPPRPSMRLSTLGEQLARVAERRRADPRALAKLIRGDLDWIAMKALEKDRTRRYDSASELARDIARHFDDEPIAARPPSRAYQLRKFVKKNKGPAAAAAVVALAIVLGASAAGWQAIRASVAAERARANAVFAYAAATEDPLLKALLIDEIADVPDMPGKLAVLRDAANYPLPLHVLHAGELANNVEYSPDGRYLAAAFMDGTARIWRADGTGEPRVLPHGDEVDALEFSPQGDRIVTGTSDGMVRVWPVEGGDPVVFVADGRVAYAHFSPDGSLVSAGIGNGTEIRIWPVDGGEPVVVELPGRDLVGGEFFPDGERILTGGRGARIWRTDGTGPIATFPSAADGWGHARMSPDGKHIAVSGGGKITIYEVDAPDSPIIVADRPGSDSWLGRFPVELLSMASLDGSAASSPGHATVTEESGWLSPEDRSWLVRNFAGSARPAVGNGGLRRSPDGTRITADLLDGTVRTWSVHGSGEPLVLDHGIPVNALAFSPDGRQIATGAADGVVRVWSSDGSGGPLVLEGHGRWAGNTTPLPWIRRPDGVSSVRFSADGRRLVTASADSTVRIWAADGSGEPIVMEHGAFVNDAAFSADGERVVTGGRDGRVLVWPGDGSGAPTVVRESPRRVESVSFGPDGRVLSASETAEVTTLGEAAERLTFRGSYFVSDAEFSPDGRWVAIGSESGDVRVLPVHGDAEPISLRGEESHVWTVAFGPAGGRVAAGTRDGDVRIWRLDASEEPLELNGHFEPVTGVAFSPDGTRVATSSLDGTVRIWRVTWPELLEYVRANLRACLTPEQRTRFLGESPSEASAAHAECERRLRGEIGAGSS